MLTVAIGRSFFLGTLLIACHAVAILSVLTLPLTWPIKLAASLILIISLLFYLLRDYWRVLPSSIIKLQLRDDGTCAVQKRHGDWEEMQLHRRNFVAFYLTVVRLKYLHGFFKSMRRKSLTLFPDSVEGELFRQLRVALKWKHYSSEKTVN